MVLKPDPHAPATGTTPEPSAARPPQPTSTPSASQPKPLDASALDEIAAAQDELDQLTDTLKQNMKQLHSLQDKFEAAVKKQAKMIKSIQSSQKAKTLAAQRTARRISSSATSSPSSSSSSSNDNNETVNEKQPGEVDFSKRLDGLKNRLKQNQYYMPCTGGKFVQLFLGSINIRFRRKSERLAFKSEYELMKLKFAPIGVIFCIICLLLPNYRWVHMIFQLSLSCYYVTLAIRENILLKNDSNIRSWWIIHHYLTMMQCVLLLTWPNGLAYSLFCNYLHVFGLYNAILMIFQTRYQMSRIYALRSLGMANEMDVASSDNTQIHWSETMSLLLPIIIFGQIMQGFLAIKLFVLASQFKHEFQIALLALLFTANFTGNVFTTFQVILHKRRHRKSKRLSSSNSSAASSSITSPSATQRPTSSSSAAAINGHEKES